MYAIAAVIVIVGLGIVIAFTRISDIIDWLQPYFPPGGSVPLTCSSSLAGWSARFR
jgi:hypothetical protein